MKTTLLRDSDTVFSEIAVAERDARAVAIERIDKHAYECRIGGDRFLFRSVRADPRAAPPRSGDRAPADAAERRLGADPPRGGAGEPRAHRVGALRGAAGPAHRAA